MFRKLVGSISLLALFMVGLYTVSAQDKDTAPPIPRVSAKLPDDRIRVAGKLPDDPVPTFVAPRPPTAPGQSVDEMLQRLAQIKEQRRQLERQERELVDQLRTAMKQHTDRLKALGYDLVPQPAASLPHPADVPPPQPPVGTPPLVPIPQPADVPPPQPPVAAPPLVPTPPDVPR